MSDLISRQAAIEALNGEVTVTGRANAEAVLGYANLVADRIKRLPSAQPERKTGHWIDGGQYAEGHPHHEWHCSVCGMSTIEVGSPWFNYCPGCGTEMEGIKGETD